MVSLGKLVGKGRTADVYMWGEDKVVKLFHKEFQRESIDFEYQVSKSIQEAFPSISKVYQTIEIDERYGIIFQFVKGSTMLDFILNKPTTILRESRKLASLHAKMHECEITDLPSQKNNFKKIIERVQLFEPSTKNKILNYLEKLPNGEKLCHSDYHPDNILISANQMIVIDWITAVKGDPAADVARTDYILRYASKEDPSKIEAFLLKILQLFAANSYLNQYRKITGMSKKEISQWEIIILAVRLTEKIPEEEAFILKRINSLLKKI
ncbi:MAG: aminoglycoside phosphotransferase family protein [Candidatus Heimdallarchaeota archaeon]